MAFNTEFLMSIVGIIKIAEIISSFLTWAIAAASKYFLPLGLGWVVFAAIVAFVVAIIFLLFYLLEVYPQSFADHKIEGIVNIIVAVMNFISGIIAAVRASQGISYIPGHGEAAASSFFAFLTMVLFAIDAFLYFFMPDTGRSSGSTMPTTATGAPSDGPNPDGTNDSNVPPQYATANY